MSVSPGVSAKYTWTWISDLPLECVDHSVRMRYYNQSDQSPWSNWITNSGKMLCWSLNVSLRVLLMRLKSSSCRFLRNVSKKKKGMKRFSTSAVIANVSFNIYLTHTMQICTWLGNKVLSATLFFFFYFTTYKGSKVKKKM